MDSLESSRATLARLEQRVKELEDDRKKFFKTGLVVLGSVVLSLLGYIWIIKVGWTQIGETKMENTMFDYVGLVAIVVGVGVAAWYFWVAIKNRVGK